ncbi:adt-1 [Symbiodinium sp. CCMP2592]|nr:adt-1 [Symbiodinium sp. CCMP2592]
MLASLRLSEWGQWTRCSATCGGGVRASLRRVEKEADYGGLPCVASLRKTETCNMQPCERSQDCVVSEWGRWHGCEVEGARQMTRQRRIETYAEGDGDPCDSPLTETAGCDDRDTLQWCSTTEWSQWTACPVACGGGQQQRSRHLSGESSCIPMAKQDLKEVRGCNVESCEENEGCILSPWTHWGQCSQDCGTGVSTRSRSIDQSAGDGGKSCHASLKEMQECVLEPCPVRDCVWHAWDSWSGCSCTCGGGLKRRARTIKVAPRAGGTPCDPSDKTQVAPCNTHSCEDCVDGRWTFWSLWSECTASCAPGYRWRHRSIARRNNDCGQPMTGLEEDYQMCEDLPICVQDEDCKVSDWTSWNDCSCSCYGVTERHRRVLQLGIGAGKKCEGKSLKEIAPCNPSEDEAHPAGCHSQGPENCTLSHWEDWGVCSKPCGVGQRTRMRQILRPLNHNGAPCEGALAQVVPCNTHHCPENNCIDCQWGAWSEWGDCSECGGQKYRQRTIEHLQNDCGHKCDPGVAKETMNCTGTCDSEYYCRWADWSDLGDCTATCGTAVKILQRRLEITDQAPLSDQDYNSSAGGLYLFAGSRSMVCSGEQTETVECDTPSCDEDCYPKNCRFGVWGEWSEPSCTQLCNRHRVIARRSSCGGKPCGGAQTETKFCPRAPCVEVVDCTISDWDDWSFCMKETGYQRLRQRTILAQAQNGGKACGTSYPAPPLSLEEIEPCEDYLALSAKNDCKFSTWREWTECTAICNGGLKHRSRGIQVPPAGGGTPCEGSLEELIPCNREPCTESTARDCELSPWSEWSHCDSHDQRERYRIIAEEPSKDGKPCNGTLKEIKPCTVAVDCILSPWTEWDSCDKSCDGGQKQRQRQVEVNPKHRGKPCDPGLIETAGCNHEPCSNEEVNCKVSIWTVWSPCSATCGPGYQERSRRVTHRLSHCGTGCVGNLTEVKPCHLDHCGNCDPCVWGEWKQWSECTRHCGGGQRHRLRNISSWPSPGCEPCKPLDKAWVEPCNTEPCPEGEICVDGLWADWRDWEACSTSCEGGVRARGRHMLRKATECGRMPDGDSHEEEPCNKGIPCKDTQDCILSEWTMWSDCSASCHGIKKRSRTVLQHGYGSGQYCRGAMEEAYPCAYGISRSLVNWDSPHLYLNLAGVSANNLDGKGPDFQAERELRFKGAAADNSQTVDLRVTVDEEGNYNAGQGVKFNGLQGSFGNIFVERNSEVVLNFELVDTVTSDPMTPEDLVIKFFDADDNQGSNNYEITAVDECEEFYNSPNPDFTVMGSCSAPGPTTFSYPAVINSSTRRSGLSNFRGLLDDPTVNLGGLGIREARARDPKSQFLQLLAEVTSHLPMPRRIRVASATTPGNLQTVPQLLSLTSRSPR